MLGDFIKLMSDIKDSLSQAKKVVSGQTNTDITKFINRSDNFTSIQRAAEKSILPFPVVISDSVSTESALILAKSVEKNMAQSIVAIAESTAQVVNSAGDSSAAASAFINRFRGIGKLSEAIENEDWDLINEMSDFLLSHHKMSPLTEEYNLEVKSIIMTTEAVNLVSPRGNGMGVAGGERSGPSKATQPTKGGEPTASAGTSVASEIMKATKFESKMAGMDPTYIKVTIKLADGARTSNVTLTLGVKAIAHLVNGDQLQKSLVGQLLDDDLVTSFIRWSTGEISFFKDLVLNYNSIKNAALKSNDNEVKSIIANLSRNASRTKMSDVTGGRSFIPNTSLILSREDVNSIKINTKQDLMKTQVAMSVLEKLNLASIIIVDELSDVAHVIYDSDLHNGYSVVSIRGEAKDNDSKRILSKLISNAG